MKYVKVLTKLPHETYFSFKSKLIKETQDCSPPKTSVPIKYLCELFHPIFFLHTYNKYRLV